MTMPSSDEKARKRMAQLQKRRQALMEAMRKDVQQLRKIIRGQAGKRQPSGRSAGLSRTM